eukprot:961180-Prymnesium_polylepis.1
MLRLMKQLEEKDARITELETRVAELESIIGIIGAHPLPATASTPPRPGRKAADEGKATDELTKSEKRRRKRRQQQTARRGAAAGAATADDGSAAAVDSTADDGAAAVDYRVDFSEAEGEAFEEAEEDGAEE